MLLLSAQVDSRVQSLSEHYDGPQPSDLCDLLEGEQFFAGFERGLDISTGLKSCFRTLSYNLLFPSDFLFMCGCEMMLKQVFVGNLEMMCYFLFPRETRLCQGKTVFRVLLQPEKSEGGVHLCSSGS